jgi:hypothetical protein
MTITGAGNVGIGTTTPYSPSGFPGVLNLYNSTSAAVTVSGNGSMTEFGSSSSGGWVTAGASLPLRLGANGGEVMRITSASNVGIGTATPATTLDVYGGSIRALSLSNPGSGTGLELGYDGTEGVIQAYVRPANTPKTIFLNPAGNVIISGTSGNVGIGTTTPSNKLDVQGGALSVNSGTALGGYPSIIELGGNTTGYNAFEATSGSLLTINKGGWANVNIVGNVGIGTTTGDQKLNVSGNIHMYSGATSLGYVYSDGSNFGLLNNAGSWALYVPNNTQSISMPGALSVGGVLTSNGGANLTGRVNVVGPTGDWAQTINWGPGSVDGYGILVGTGTGKYSQFQNQEGYWIRNAYGGYGAYSNGAAYFGGTIQSGSDTYSNNFYHNSDRRLKDDIKPIVGLAIVDKLNGVTFTWKKDHTLSAGVIAQDVEAVIPESVHTDTKGMKSVSYDTLIAPMIEAVKELHSLFNTDHDILAKLKADNDGLRAEFEAYKKAHP